MKFNYAPKEIFSNAVIESRRCSMANNAKAFRISFSQIYPDIIKAIVREIISNAWDSQKLAENLDKPIDITTPSVFEPEFSVRDYGVGMSHDFVMEMFSTFFESTKDEGNEEVGQNGIGSKTPLGYADSFSLQCWGDSETRIYEILIGKDGFPIINLRFRGATAEPDGVKVTMAVKNDDLTKFNQSIETFLDNFPTSINVDGVSFKPKVERSPILSGKNWKLFEKRSQMGFLFRMGCITYNCPQRTDHMLNNNIIIDVPIGEFQVTTSREQIIINDDVNKRLGEWKDKFLTEYNEVVNSVIKNRRLSLRQY